MSGNMGLHLSGSAEKWDQRDRWRCTHEAYWEGPAHASLEADPFPTPGNKLEIPESWCFSSSRAQKRTSVTTQTSRQRKRTHASSPLLFHASLHLTGRGPPRLERAICCTQSPSANGRHMQKHPTDMPRRRF